MLKCGCGGLWFYLGPGADAPPSLPPFSTFRDYQPLSTLFFPCWHFKKAFKLSCEGFLLSVQSDYAGNLFVYDFGEVPLERGRQGLIKICRRSRIHSVITVWVKVWG